MMRRRTRSTTNFSIGVAAEWVAWLYLRCKGYRKLVRRFKTPMGEVDIICQQGATLVAVEVKFRPTYRQGVEAITANQKKRVEAAMLLFCQKRRSMNRKGRSRENPMPSLRFDVVIIQPWSWPRHIKNAW